jgi:hypothetical protein
LKGDFGLRKNEFVSVAAFRNLVVAYFEFHQRESNQTLVWSVNLLPDAYSFHCARNSATVISPRLFFHQGSRNPYGTMTFYVENIDIPHCMSIAAQKKVETMKIQTRHLLLTILLTMVILTLQPIAKADQFQTGTVTITAIGQASLMGNETKQGNPASVNMNLTEIMVSYGGSHIQFQNLTGSLNIGSENYTMSNGLGEVGDQGEVQIDASANTNNTDFQLELHGTMQGSNLIFNSPDNKLAPLYTLLLTGQVTTTTQTAIVTQPQTESEIQSQNTTTNSSDPSTQVQTISSVENATTSETVLSTTSSLITTPSSNVANETTSTTSSDLLFSSTTNSTITTQATSTVAETLQSTNSTLVTAATTTITNTGTNQTLATTAPLNSTNIQPTVTTTQGPTNSTRSEHDSPASLHD